jgi:hypothetical protein
MNLCCKNIRPVHGSVRSPLKGDRIDSGPAIETTAFYFYSVTNFYRIPGENSFSFQACDDGGRVIRGNFNAGHDFGNAQLS